MRGVLDFFEGGSGEFIRTGEVLSRGRLALDEPPVITARETSAVESSSIGASEVKSVSSSP